MLSLNDLVDETVAALSHIMNDKGLELHVDATKKVRGEYIGHRQKLK